MQNPVSVPVIKEPMENDKKDVDDKKKKKKMTALCSAQEQFGVAYYREKQRPAHCPYRELTVAPQCDLVDKLESGLKDGLAKRWGKFGALFKHKMRSAKESQHRMSFVPDRCVQFAAAPGLEGYDAGYMRLTCDKSGFGVMVSDDAYCRKGRHWFRMQFTNRDSCFSCRHVVDAQRAKMEELRSRIRHNAASAAVTVVAHDGDEASEVSGDERRIAVILIGASGGALLLGCLVWCLVCRHNRKRYGRTNTALRDDESDIEEEDLQLSHI